MTDRIHLGLGPQGRHPPHPAGAGERRGECGFRPRDRAAEGRTANAQDQLTPTSAKPDPANNPDRIVIKGVPPDATGDLRSLVSDRLPEYDATSGAENSWVLNMKQQQLTELKNRAVAQAIETIRNRVDKLGVSEPVIQEHGLGDYQILVQLPGIDDPARVKEIMQSTAMLEIRQAMNNGAIFKDEQAALAAVQRGAARQQRADARTKNQGDRRAKMWSTSFREYPAVAGHDLREARVGPEFADRPAGSELLPDGRRRTALLELHRRSTWATIWPWCWITR